MVKKKKVKESTKRSPAQVRTGSVKCFPIKILPPNIYTKGCASEPSLLSLLGERDLTYGRLYGECRRHPVCYGQEWGAVGLLPEKVGP